MITRIEELAEKYGRRFVETSHDLTGRDLDFLEWQALEHQFRAALAEFREEAAKCAEERSDVAKIGNVYHYLNDKYTRGVCDASEQIASAIRKL